MEVFHSSILYTSTTVPTVGIATTTGVIDTAFDITISGIATAGVQIGDSVTVK